MTKKIKLGTRYVALSCRVLVVAVQGDVTDWAAYIDAVAGISHIEEMNEVARKGTKLDKRIAEILFPDFAKQLTWKY